MRCVSCVGPARVARPRGRRVRDPGAAPTAARAARAAATHPRSLVPVLRRRQRGGALRAREAGGVVVAPGARRSAGAASDPAARRGAAAHEHARAPLAALQVYQPHVGHGGAVGGQIIETGWVTRRAVRGASQGLDWRKPRSARCCTLRTGASVVADRLAVPNPVQRQALRRLRQLEGFRRPRRERFAGPGQRKQRAPARHRARAAAKAHAEGLRAPHAAPKGCTPLDTGGSGVGVWM